MAKFLKSALLFIPFLIATYSMGVIAWGILGPDFLKYNLKYEVGSYGYMYSRAKDIKKIHGLDILFLGSSHAYRGFDPRIFKKYGLTSFNLGSSAQTPLQTECLIRKYLDQANPKLVIYEVFPILFGNDGVESSIDLIANEYIDFNTVRMALLVNDINTLNTLIYGIYRQVSGKNVNFKEAVRKKDDFYISGIGYVEKDLKYYTDTTTYVKTTVVVYKKQMAAFDRSLNLLKSQKIPFILVQTPLVSALYKSLTNNKELDNLFSSKGPYINFNEQMALNDSLHFYDSGHLNQNGVKLLNEKLINLLSKMPLIDSILKITSTEHIETKN